MDFLRSDVGFGLWMDSLYIACTLYIKMCIMELNIKVEDKSQLENEKLDVDVSYM